MSVLSKISTKGANYPIIFTLYEVNYRIIFPLHCVKRLLQGYCPIKVCKPIYLLSLYLDIK